VIGVEFGKNVIKKETGRIMIERFKVVYLPKAKSKDSQPLLTTAAPVGQIFINRGKGGVVERKIIVMTTGAGIAAFKIERVVFGHFFGSERRRVIIKTNGFYFRMGVMGKKMIKVLNEGRAKIVNYLAIFDQ